MRQELWDIYLAVQTSHAYGAGCARTWMDVLAPQAMRRTALGDGAGRALVIGPGGPSEVAAVRELAYGAEVHAITAHAPEAEALVAASVAAVRGDMHDMPYPSGFFSFLFASNVLEHALAPYVALMECRRVLREGGRATFIMPAFDGSEGGRGPFHLHCLDGPTWEELLRKTGHVLRDRWRVEGAVDPRGGYEHFVCEAGEPPWPHVWVLRELIAFKGAAV